MVPASGRGEALTAGPMWRVSSHARVSEHA